MLTLIVVIGAMCLGSVAVEAFAEDYVFVTQWDISGYPTGIALDNTGNIYVSDQGNTSVQKI
ncbi:secreted protein, partial [Candidatus Magnetobacterium bavaricum]